MTPYVSILLPIRNESRHIEHCLEAVLAQEYPSDRMEVLVVDGMSTDDTREKVRQIAARHAGVRLEILANPQGIVPTGLNIALQQARGDVLIRVDGHTLLAPDYVRQCVQTLQRTHADNAGGRMTAQGNTSFGQAVALATSTPFGVGGGRFHYSDQEEWVDTVYMGAWPRVVFEKIGLFDEELVRDQDDEFSYRLRSVGGRIFLNPAIRSEYTVRSTPAALWQQYYQYGYWKIRVLQKHPLQMRMRQFVPPAFVFGLLFSLISSFLFPWGKFLFAFAGGSYILANLFASMMTAAKKGWSYLAILPLSFAILHLSYGLGFLVGLVKFSNCWSDPLGSVPDLSGEPIYISSPIRPHLSDFLKRVVDVLVAFWGLILLSPVFLMIAAMIKRESPGPAFYRGPRTGKGGKAFGILKFRTMRGEPAGYGWPIITARDDPRVTPLGRWLRDTKLNELPQLWNVLIGEMSLVGPRPEDPQIAATWPTAIRQEILSVRPGITSPASVAYHDEEKLLSTAGAMNEYAEHILPDKLRLDQLYVRHRNFIIDLDALFWTFVVLIPRLGNHKIPEGWLFGGPVTRLVRRYVSWTAIDFLAAFASITLAGVLWRLNGPLDIGLGRSVQLAVLLALLFGLANALLGLKAVEWSRAAAEDVSRLIFSCLLVTGMVALYQALTAPMYWIPQRFLYTAGLMVLASFIAVRYRLRLVTGLANRWINLRQGGTGGERVLVVGGGAGSQFATWLLRRPDFRGLYRVVGIVDDSPSKQGMRMDGVRVLGTTADIPELVGRYDIGMIFFSISRISEADRQRILSTCQGTGLHLVMLPEVLKTIHSQLRRDASPEEALPPIRRAASPQAGFLNELQVKEEA